MILATLMASLGFGMPSRIRQCQPSALFWIRQSQSRIKRVTIESTVYLKVEPMMAQSPILSEDTKKREMGELLLGIL